MAQVPDAVLAATTNLRLRASMLLGSGLEGGWNSPFPVGDQGTSFGPFQLHEGGMLTSLGLTQQQAENPKIAVKAMMPTYAQAVNQISDRKWSADPESAAEQAAVLAERPAQDYFTARGRSTVNQVWHATERQLRGKHSTGGMPPQDAHTTAAGDSGGLPGIGAIWSVVAKILGLPSFSTAGIKSGFERIGLVLFGAALILVGLLILTYPVAKTAVSETAGMKTRIGRLGGGGGGGRDEEDIARRQAIADRSLELGERKLELQRQRESRLAGNIS